MKYIKNFNIILVLLFLSACNYIHDYSPILPVKDYLIVETAIDSNIEGARSKALNLLSQDIFVQVKSNFEIIENLNSNGKFYSTNTNQITLNSTGYFQDIIFSPPKIINKGYKVSAGLSSKALLNTINYLENNLKISSINTLNDEDLKSELSKTNFLMALNLYAKNNNLNYVNTINQEQLINYKDALTLRLSNVVKLTFNIIPSSVNIAKINILNKDYNPNEIIFLPYQNTYLYTVYAEGYKTITNKIEVSESKEKISINVYLQKLLNTPLKVKLEICGDEQLDNIIKFQLNNLIEKYQLTNNSFTNNILKIQFLPKTSNKIDNYYYFTFPINISLIKDGTIVQSNIFNITYVNSNANGYISPHIIIKKLDEFLEEITSGNNLYNAYIKNTK